MYVTKFILRQNNFYGQKLWSTKTTQQCLIFPCNLRKIKLIKAKQSELISLENIPLEGEFSFARHVFSIFREICLYSCI